jgi:tRNA pseudouridine38-40 synthase
LSDGAPAVRNVRLDLAYDGTAFTGWQVQPGRRTVQGTLEAALSRLQGGEPVRLRAAGRTDAGVHARGQVADGLVRSRLEDAGLARALACILPTDVAVLRVRTVPHSFHSRRDARAKTYAYRLDLTAHGDPFLARFAWHHPWPLDHERLAAALARLPGRRDWSGFAGAASTAASHVRCLSEARHEVVGGAEARFEFRADGFLNHMVRNLVGTLVEIASGRMPPERLDRILAEGDRRLAGPTAPARGLCLERVAYGDDVEAPPVRH